MTTSCNYAKKNSGLINTIILIFIGVLILSYLGISVKDVVNSPAGQSNFGYIKETSIAVWNKYLKEPATYLSNTWVRLFWHPFVENIENLNNGRRTTIDPGEVNIQ